MALKPPPTLAQACLNKGGAYVLFSQSFGEVNELIRKVPDTSNGICQALAARWMVEHANNGSFWLWLRDGNANNPVNQWKIGQLMMQAVSFVKRSGPMASPHTAMTLANVDQRLAEMGDLGYQDFVTTKYLDAMAGLMRRGATAAHVQQETTHGCSAYTGLMLALRLNYKTLNAPGGCYVLIGATRQNGRGHAMAAFVSKDDIAFFDPNFGEFYFPRGTGNTGNTGYIQGFVDWFQYFWRLSGYQDKYSSFRLLSYGKRTSLNPYQGYTKYA